LKTSFYLSCPTSNENNSEKSFYKKSTYYLLVKRRYHLTIWMLHDLVNAVLLYISYIWYDAIVVHWTEPKTLQIETTVMCLKKMWKSKLFSQVRKHVSVMPEMPSLPTYHSHFFSVVFHCLLNLNSRLWFIFCFLNILLFHLVKFSMLKLPTRQSRPLPYPLTLIPPLVLSLLDPRNILPLSQIHTNLA
jgi:hypothetical protein